MSLFNKLNEPIFLKETSSAIKQLEQLKAIERDLLPVEVGKQLDKEIKLLSLGIQGEKNIDFELRNSHIPMYVLHDLYLEDEGLSAQIDYLVITRKCSFVIECKNLYGNIEINEKGDFIRTFNNSPKEGIYSPVTQNQRHLEMLKRIRLKAKKNIITKSLFEKNFNNDYRSIIVLANPKTVLYDKKADKSIKSQVIRADSLISYIKQVNRQRDSFENSNSEMKGIAEYFLSAHIERDIDYTEKYRPYIEKNVPHVLKNETLSTGNDIASTNNEKLCPRCGSGMVFRTAKKGDNAGKQFWGCSTFPKCRGVIENSDISGEV